MYYDDYYKNLGKALEKIVNPPYLKQMQLIANPPWLKEMQSLTKAMNTYYSDFAIPSDSISKALRSISVLPPKLDSKKIEKAFRPFYGNESLMKGIDISVIAPGIAESLTTITSAAAAIAASQSSIDELSQGLSKSIPNIFGNYSFDSILDKIGAQTSTETLEDVDEPIDWEDIHFEEEEIVYRDVIVTKEDVDELMTSEPTDQYSNAETWKTKVAVIFEVISILIMLLSVLDIPSNWTIQKGYQFIEEHVESQEQKYYVFMDFANVYANPETSSEKLDRLMYGSIITAIDENEFWIKIELSDSKESITTGWVQKTKIDRYYSD